MRIEVRTRNLAGAEGLRQHAGRRLRFALGRFDTVVERVRVRLEDINGPRGGVDKRCRIVVNLKAAGEVVVEDTDASAQALLDRSAERVGRMVQRRIERLRDPSARRSVAA